MAWDLSCQDWWDRLKSGRSLVPDLPLWTAEAAGIRRDPGMSDRTVPYLWSLRRGRVLCDHFWQPADSGYRTSDRTDSIWKRRGEA